LKAGVITLFIMLALVGIVIFVVGIWELFSSYTIIYALEMSAVVIVGIGLITYASIRLVTGGYEK
jgi:hypothetical protein